VGPIELDAAADTSIGIAGAGAGALLVRAGSRAIIADLVFSTGASDARADRDSDRRRWPGSVLALETTPAAGALDRDGAARDVRRFLRFRFFTRGL
jgi:hypothetical protein